MKREERETLSISLIQDFKKKMKEETRESDSEPAQESGDREICRQQILRGQKNTRLEPAIKSVRYFSNYINVMSSHAV